MGCPHVTHKPTLTWHSRHDDITYQSIARAFDLQLKLHDAAYERMKRLSKPHKSQPNFDWNVPSAALTAKKRMVELPIDDAVPDEDQVIFVNETLWVPVSCVNGNVQVVRSYDRWHEAPHPASFDGS